MKSFRIGIDPRARRAAHFIARVQSELRRAFSEENEARGLTRQELAEKLGMDKSLLSRRLSGKANLTLATIAELAHGLDRDVHFELQPRTVRPGQNVGAGTAAPRAVVLQVAGGASAVARADQGANRVRFAEPDRRKF